MENSDNLIIRLLIGSRMFGINAEDADYDYLDIVWPARDEIIRQVVGMNNESLRGSHVVENGEDVQTFGIYKFMANLHKGNFYLAEAMMIGTPIWQVGGMEWFAHLYRVSKMLIRTQATIRSAFGMIQADLMRGEPKNIARAWATANNACDIVRKGYIDWNYTRDSQAMIAIRAGGDYAKTVARTEIDEMVASLEKEYVSLPLKQDDKLLLDLTERLLRQQLR